MNLKRLWLVPGIAGVLLTIFIYRFLTDWRYEVPTDSQVTIRLTRSGCFGSCAVFQVTLYENGTVVYHGRQHVGISGIRKTNIGADQVQQLAARLDEMGYFSLHDSYGQPGGDGPSVSMSVQVRDKEKTVLHHYDFFSDYPDSLSDMEQTIYETSRAERWVNACSFRYPHNCQTNIIFWFFSALPVVIAIRKARPLIKQGKPLAGIVRGEIVIVISWLAVLWLVNFRGDLFGITSSQASGFYSALGFAQLLLVLFIGSFLKRRYARESGPDA